MIRHDEIHDWWLGHRVGIQARAIEAAGAVAAPPGAWALWQGWAEARAVGVPAGVSLGVLGALVAWPVGGATHAALRSLGPRGWHDRAAACHPREVAGALHAQLLGWVERSHQR